MRNPVEPKTTFCSSLIDRVLERDNLLRALKQARRNKSALGVDGMSVDDLLDHLKQHWPQIRQQLIDGNYKPKPVRRVEISKPDGRKRKLGILTVLDRFIQQAIAQVMQEEWEVDFHDNSYGFRPNRNAHQAMRYAQNTVRQGYSWAVDCDLEAFFDGVNHDLLMEQLKAKHQDRRLRSYIWNQCGRKGYRMLRHLGVDRWLAWNTAKSAHGPWRLSASPALYRELPNRYFKNLGLPLNLAKHRVALTADLSCARRGGGHAYSETTPND